MARECWAACLGGCNGLSREHVVSQIVIATECGCPVKMSGFRRMPTVSLPVSALTSRILCAKHNSDLSPLDAEAGRLNRYLRTLGRGDIEDLSVDGSLIDRWLLKTILNVLSAGWADETKWKPEPQLVRAIFGFVPIPEHMSFSAVDSDPGPTDDGFSLTISWTDLAPGVRFPVGAHVTMEGMCLFMPLRHDVLKNVRLLIEGGAEGMGRFHRTHVHRPAAIRIEGKTGTARVRFQWPNGRAEAT